jgi:hypothetical protein
MKWCIVQELSIDWILKISDEYKVGIVVKNCTSL